MFLRSDRFGGGGVGADGGVLELSVGLLGTDFLPFSLLPFVKSLFGQVSQSNACDKFHKACAKEMLSLFAEKAFWGKAQTM